MTLADAFDLDRFTAAQAPVYATVTRELQAGEKRTHWIWFIFPQLRGLGRSSTAQFFGISSLAEARAYLDHPELGARLIECVAFVLQVNGRSLNAIFGSPDDMKFVSCMTLFAQAAGLPESIFSEALQRYCNGTADEQTMRLLQPPSRKSDEAALADAAGGALG